MESVVRKCLNIREKSFEVNSCPTWLLTILPTRIKSIESIHENDNEQQTKQIEDLSPFKLISSIPLLNEKSFSNISHRNSNLTNSNFEYPNDFSFENNELIHSYEYLCSPSNQQLFYLLNKLKQFQPIQSENSSQITKTQCEIENCSKETIPLSQFCKIHLIENDSKQILFAKCNLCQQLSIHHDKKSLLHFCLSFK